MKIQFIRNAAMKIHYAGKTILTDPMLSTKGTLDSFAGIARNPTIDLPFKAEEVVKGIDFVLISHTHPDHYDQAAANLLQKDIPIFIQPEDKQKMTNDGFVNAQIVSDSILFNNITINRTTGLHGSGEILKYMGNVSGYVLRASGEPTVYWVGDTIWYDEIEKNIKLFNPDIIITHSGGAIKPGYEKIIMDAEETLSLIKSASKAKIIAIHMESLDHCQETRKSLRLKADQAGISNSKLIIPNDGEFILF